MGFMIAVKGGRAPECVHENLDAAVREAVRLQESIIGQRGSTPEVRVLQEVLTLPCRIVNQPIDFSAVKVQDYSQMVTMGTLMHVMRKSHVPYPSHVSIR